jgi:spore photoproduct lyase
MSEIQNDRLKVHFAEYEMLDGTKKTLIKQVGNGSIIKRFEMTPEPKAPNDIVCPHFIEFKWALGCPFDCAWCYLKGSLRHYPLGKSFVPKPYSKIQAHLKRLFRAPSTEPEVLNAGEVADALAGEHLNPPFSKFVIPLFEQQDKFKLLFLTKSTAVNNLLEINPHNNVIVSFSLNAEPVADRWERAPSVKMRIKAAKTVFESGYETRIRIDPIVPYPPNDWKEHYIKLIDLVFSEIYPSRITLGSLRGLQSTINEAQDKSWVEYLTEPSKWGRRIPFDLRHETFALIIDYLEEKYGYNSVALCKEPVLMWDSLGMNWRRCTCNCVW